MTNSNQMEKNVSLKKKLIVTSMAAALGLTGAPVVMAESATLEEIIVTSRQRAESSQDIPMTVDVLSGEDCLLYTSPSPRDKRQSRMPSCG